MNAEQRSALQTFELGCNMFITGPAGTGKSYTLKYIIQKAIQEEKVVGITASTGLAACLIKGRTLHSYLGIGLATKDVSLLARAALQNKSLKSRLTKLDVLVVDEISQIDGELFDKVCKYLQFVRHNDAPFGGVQLVLCGDFCQLPPVKGSFCFESDSWKTSDIHICQLKTLVRQSEDVEFQNMLSILRWGNCDDTLLETLQNLQTTTFPEHIRPTVLYSKNIDVDQMNIHELKAVGGPTNTYKTVYSSHPITIQWANSLRIADKFECCVGAQVMVTHNSTTDPSIVNGTRGVIVKVFHDSVIIKLVNGREVSIGYTKLEHDDCVTAYVSFMPLKLAYAITIHKSQGMTLDAVEMDLGQSIFENGQAYTALSRARSLQSVKISNVLKKSFKTHPAVIDFYKGIDA